MKLFAGLTTTDYQDILRAIGLFVDQQRLRDIRIWEHEHGIIVQGRSQDDMNGRYESILLSGEDLQALLEDAYRRRNGQLDIGSSSAR
jgi:hypothetical protein